MGPHKRTIDCFLLGRERAGVALPRMCATVGVTAQSQCRRALPSGGVAVWGPPSARWAWLPRHCLVGGRGCQGVAAWERGRLGPPTPESEGHRCPRVRPPARALPPGAASVEHRGRGRMGRRDRVGSCEEEDKAKGVMVIYSFCRILRVVLPNGVIKQLSFIESCLRS